MFSFYMNYWIRLIEWNKMQSYSNLILQKRMTKFLGLFVWSYGGFLDDKEVHMHDLHSLEHNQLWMLTAFHHQLFKFEKDFDKDVL
jgi:hypothetical protein